MKSGVNNVNHLMHICCSRSVVIFHPQHSPDLATCTSGKAMVRRMRQNGEFCCYFLQTRNGLRHPREVIYGLAMLIITRECCGITWYNHKTLRRSLYRFIEYYVSTLGPSTIQQVGSLIVPRLGVASLKHGRFRFSTPGNSDQRWKIQVLVADVGKWFFLKEVETTPSIVVNVFSICVQRCCGKICVVIFSQK